jgi:hypothetical protein
MNEDVPVSTNGGDEDSTPYSEVVAAHVKIDKGRLGPAHVADVVCDATAKSTGMRCGNPAVRGSTKCRMHGGHSLAGVASPMYRTGRYSKYLPAKLREAYEDASNDEELLSSREEIALLSARVAELAGRLRFGDSGSLWADLRDVYDELQAAMNKNEVERMTACLLRMGDIIRMGNDNEGMWSEIRDTCETLNRVRASENKRQVELRQLIAAPQAIALMMAVVQIVQRNVTDARVLNRIQREVSLLLDVEEGAAEAQPADGSNGESNL